MPHPSASFSFRHRLLDGRAGVIAGAIAGAIGLVLAGLMAATVPAGAQPYLDGGTPLGGGGGSYSSDPTGGFLDGGGPLRRSPVRRFAPRDRGFLSGGGSIRDVPDVVIGERPRTFLGGAGSITTTPSVGFDDDREEFLEDGGFVSTRPNVLIDDLGDGYRAPRRIEAPYPPRRRFRTFGSFSDISIDDRDGGSRRYDDGGRRAGSVLPSGPSSRIVDVERERIDRRSRPASGIEVLSSTGAKIIRLSSGFGRRARGAERR